MRKACFAKWSTQNKNRAQRGILHLQDWFQRNLAEGQNPGGATAKIITTQRGILHLQDWFQRNLAEGQNPASTRCWQTKLVLQNEAHKIKTERSEAFCICRTGSKGTQPKAKILPPPDVGKPNSRSFLFLFASYTQKKTIHFVFPLKKTLCSLKGLCLKILFFIRDNGDTLTIISKLDSRFKCSARVWITWRNLGRTCSLHQSILRKVYSGIIEFLIFWSFWI